MSEQLQTREPPAWRLHPFNAMCEGHYAQSHCEDRIAEILGVELLGIGFDWYDDSFEIFPSEEVADVAPTAEQHAQILALGCTRYWINFPDDTQRYGTGERRTSGLKQWDTFNRSCEERRAIAERKDEQIRKLREALDEIISVDVLSPEGGHEAVAEIHCIARAVLKELGQ